MSRRVNGLMRTHKDLKVWQRSMDLVENIYKSTNTFPKEEIYGIVAQMRRSAISVPSNIAEGAARQGNKECIQFLYVALGSLSELETQCLICKRLEYLKKKDIFDDIEILRRQLLNLIKYKRGKMK